MGTPLEMEIALPHAISHEGMALTSTPLAVPSCCRYR